MTLGDKNFEIARLSTSPLQNDESTTVFKESMSVLAAPTSSEGISTLFEDKIRRFNKIHSNEDNEQGIEEMGGSSTEVFEENSDDEPNDAFYPIFK